MHGLPTFTASQEDCNCNADTEHVEGLGVMKTDWKRTFLAGEPNMADYIARTECSVCAKERYRRRRVSYQDQMVTSDSTEFSHAPALYSFNVPRYFAILLRAQSFALSEQVQLTWCYAKDTPLHPEDRELPTEKLDAKRMAWLQRHDQDTSHLTSMLPLAVGLPVRLTDNVDRQLQLYRGRRGAIHGWTLDPFCESSDANGDMLLDRLPLVIYVLFREATWKIGTLPEGVYPLTPRSRTWKINKSTGMLAKRKGYTLLPDFASTAHMIQGATLDAAYADLLEASTKPTTASQIAAYVCLSRVKELERIVVMQPFSPHLFTRGPPLGPHRLIDKLAGNKTTTEVLESWNDGELGFPAGSSQVARCELRPRLSDCTLRPRLSSGHMIM